MFVYTVGNEERGDPSHNFIATSFSISAVHFRANSSSVKRLADCLALCLMATGSLMVSASSNALLNSADVLA